MNDIDAAYRRAGDLADVGRYAEAEQIVRTALAQAPDEAPLLTMLGYLLRRQERYLDALAACDAAVALAPDRPAAHEERAWVLIDIWRTEEAVTAATEAVRLNPHHSDPYLALAEALSGEDRFDEARDAAQQALRLAPRSAAGLLALADVERSAGEADAARRAARQALAIEPASTRGRRLLAMLDADQGKVRRSMRTLAAVAQERPADPDLDTLLWPIRRVVVKPRWWLTGAAAFVAGIDLLTSAVDHPTAGEAAARGGAALTGAVTVGFVLRVLAPAGRLPWRALRLSPPLVRRSLGTGLAVIAVTVGLLTGYATGGPLVLAMPAVAVGPILAACWIGERLGHSLDDAGDRQFLQDIREQAREMLRDLREWPAQTRRDLHASWHAGDAAEEERKQRQAEQRRPLAVYADQHRNNILCAAFGIVAVLAVLAAAASRPSTAATIGFGLFALLMLHRCIRVRAMKAVAAPEGLILHGTVLTFIVRWDRVAQVTGDDSIPGPKPLRAPVLVLTTGRRWRVKQAAFYHLRAHGSHDPNARVHRMAAELESIRLAHSPLPEPPTLITTSSTSTASPRST